MSVSSNKRRNSAFVVSGLAAAMVVSVAATGAQAAPAASNATKNAAENSEYWNSDVTKTKMLHIRRGDFISTKANVGLLRIEYFASKVKKGEKVIIFTDAKKDDPEIEGSFPNSVIFGSDSLDTWTSFSLLSHTSHLIASNSTFSWWAGFISLMRGGSVTAPNPWTRTSIYGEHYLETKGFSVSPSQFVEV